jgi:hypothetical protein
VVTLLDIALSTREDQEVIRNVCGGTPDLFTGQNPPSVSTHGFGAQSAEDVGATTWLRKADCGAQLSFGYLRQEPLLLSLRAIHPNRLAAGK